MFSPNGIWWNKTIEPWDFLLFVPMYVWRYLPRCTLKPLEINLWVASAVRKLDDCDPAEKRRIWLVQWNTGWKPRNPGMGKTIASAPCRYRFGKLIKKLHLRPANENVQLEERARPTAIWLFKWAYRSASADSALPGGTADRLNPRIISTLGSWRTLGFRFIYTYHNSLLAKYYWNVHTLYLLHSRPGFSILTSWPKLKAAFVSKFLIAG